jgi:hypothetical protein
MTYQGWMPDLGEYLTLAEVIDLAFDYRGNVTVAKVDGAEVEGYIFNRNADVPEPFIQMFDLAGNGPFKLLYSEIQIIKFTGKDTAAGNSWLAWLERREKEKAEKAALLGKQTA